MFTALLNLHYLLYNQLIHMHNLLHRTRHAVLNLIESKSRFECVKLIEFDPK